MDGSKTVPRDAQLPPLIEHVPGVAFRVAYVNDRWETWFVTKSVSMFGYTPEDFMGGRIEWSDIIHPDDKVLVCKMIEDYACNNINSFTLYYRLIDANGDCVPVTEYNIVNRDRNGNIICYDTVLVKNTKSASYRSFVDDHYRQQAALNDILMSLHSSDLYHALRIILDRSGEYLNCSRVLLFEDNPDHRSTRLVYEWDNSDIPSMGLEYQILYEHIPEIVSALEASGKFLVDAGDIPSGSQGEFDVEKVVSAAVFAVYVDGQRYGFICFDDCIVERRWDENTVAFLQNIANLTSTAVARQRATSTLTQNRKTYEAVLDNVDSYIFVTELGSERIIFANQFFKSTFGADCFGKDARQFLDLDSIRVRDEDSGQWRYVAGFGGYPEVYNKASDQWLAVSSDVITWVDGQDVNLINCYDTTSKKLYADTVEKMAFLDHLTGLPNRYKCDVDVALEIGDSRLDDSLGYLLFIDLDDFKIVNDCYGHDYGDAILVSFADYLKGSFGGFDKVFRFGGDEFVLLLSHRSKANVYAVLKQLHDRAMKPWKALDREFFCTLSIGVTAVTANSDSSEVIKYADMAMYEAKRKGKNQYEFYAKELENSSMQRSQMEALLRRSMDNGFEGFRVLYQPVVDAVSGRICGAEALLRMVDGDRVIMPDEFLSLANYLGFMVPIGEFVMREAATVCRRICEAGNEDFVMTVNISSKQMSEKNVNVRIDQILHEVGLESKNFAISINEDEAIENSGRMRKMCEKLRDAGIQIVLDEFGGGSSSFINLQDLPVDVIKIAKLFMQKLGDEYSRDFMELIIRQSRSMKKKVCLNGVETQEQMLFGKSMGVEQLQGFYLYTVKDAKALEERVAGV